LRAAAWQQFRDRALTEGRGRLVPGEGGNPAHFSLLQLHRVGQCRAAFIQHQRDRLARNLRAIQHPQHACQGTGEFLAIGQVAAIDVMAQAHAMLPIQHIAEAHLAEIVPALLVMAALRQVIAGVVTGNIGVEVSGVIGQQTPTHHLLFLPQSEQAQLRLVQRIVRHGQRIQTLGEDLLKRVPEILGAEAFRRKSPSRL